MYILFYEWIWLLWSSKALFYIPLSRYNSLSQYFLVLGNSWMLMMMARRSMVGSIHPYHLPSETRSNIMKMGATLAVLSQRAHVKNKKLPQRLACTNFLQRSHQRWQQFQWTIELIDRRTTTNEPQHSSTNTKQPWIIPPTPPPES